MKIPYAARFAALSWLAAALYAWLQMRPALTMAGDLGARQSWILTHALQWSVGWWLWLVAIFCWMALLVVLSWSYLPAHRVAGSLQSGLMIIAALLAIAGINVWMGVLPVVLAQAEPESVTIRAVDALARSFLGSGALMGGITTTWIAFDLFQQKLLARPWLALLMASGVCMLLAPFLSFNFYILLLALVGWLLPCLWLSIRPQLPSPFAAWPER